MLPSEVLTTVDILHLVYHVTISKSVVFFLFKILISSLPYQRAFNCNCCLQMSTYLCLNCVQNAYKSEPYLYVMYNHAACPDGTYGEDCSNACTCNTQNSVSCDHVTGACSCSEGWSGTTCNDDINECSNGSTTCPVHSDCLNTEGDYVCQCQPGYFKNSSSLCEGKVLRGDIRIFKACLHPNVSFYGKYLMFQVGCFR